MKRLAFTARRTGQILSGLVGLALVFTAAAKLSGRPEVTEQLGGHLGFPEDLIPWLAAMQFAGVALFLFPRTAVLGGVFLTAYLGGATAAVVRIGDPPWLPVTVAVAVWIALLLRDPALRHLMPWRRPRK
ncbi:MAG: DoxX family protein [Planctomycetota bacterium]